MKRIEDVPAAQGQRRRTVSVAGVADSFPRQYARTQRLTLGEPRDLTVSPDGRRVVFARSRGGADPINCLWSADVASGTETLLVDPTVIMTNVAADLGGLPPEERARRERLREGAGGITGYAVDRNVGVAAFSLGGTLFVTDLATGETDHLDVPGPVFDPRPSPDGKLVAYVRGPELRVTDRSGTDRPLVGHNEADEHVSWGSAEFIAAEEMGRYRGFWWGPDGSMVAVCRVDVSPVAVWHISNPADPSGTPMANRYPAAGTANAEVSLHLVTIDDGARVAVDWDREELPYLADVNWTSYGLTLTVQSRDQRLVKVLVVDVATGATIPVWTDHDDTWVDLIPGTGALVADGIVVMCANRGDRSSLVVGGEVVSPVDIQVRSVTCATAERIVVTGNPLTDPTVMHVYEWTPNSWRPLTDGAGVHTAAVGGETVVIRSAVMDEPGARWRLPSGASLDRCAERPIVSPNVTLHIPDDRLATTAVLLPHDHDGSPLPVLLDPYGGPHAQRVIRSHNAFCASQWFADQGFAVVVADGRGTPGRGSAHERAVAGDLASFGLDDQVDALHAAADRHPEIDLGRVAIRGWSFGGYLAALAVLRRPDVFHAAIAGAPVTEWRLYDTHYTERYLGDPNARPETYDASSLLPLASQLSRPLLLIHGLADDNVVAAHTLRLSQALLAAGRPHEVLPLVGVTHMTPQETVAENLLLHQLDFLRRSLGLTTTK
jgi:dipeptidyl-peptidase 4